MWNRFERRKRIIWQKRIESGISSVIMALVFMWAMPYGTFDPVDAGFYISIITAVSIESIIWFLLDKFAISK